MDGHHLGDGVQARGPGEAAAVQRSRHQHQGQGEPRRNELSNIPGVKVRKVKEKRKVKILIKLLYSEKNKQVQILKNTLVQSDSKFCFHYKTFFDHYAKMKNAVMEVTH